ncbi:protein disaggregation chaperone [Achromobacter spanius]|uniref:type VI secretion system ATPase TssH n=1 Tax=Achromobacter spanius TaxID=217203 RepID=UPI000C2C3167|nr:type VI secretion system ATPase TssH [Achromobacter spanius]AUA56076.1 type VI secretion system ATPase TssH [Achromobacter spanius]CAB3642056.1 Protein ClpV1 [Achromobacter spanius]SPT41668.1 protein disaggregation chaperone [Achromobacter denitrificans]VEE56384.1 protein disaggregation chaperone [Achromobacter spanius]
MMLVELKPLFARLNPTCSAALEGAAGLTLARNHYEIAVEHMLRRLVEEPGGDVHCILAHFDIDPLRLTAQLDESLAQLKNGNPGRPVFAGLLTEWAQESWLTASITLGESRVRSGAMLLALVSRLSYYGAGTRYAETLRAISRDKLTSDFDTIVNGSNEASTQIADSASGGSARPAAAGDAAINRFCEDFTAKAAAGKIDPVFGRDSEIRQMIDILARRRKNNPICVGEPGVGKTAVVEGLALRIINGDVPEFLRDTRLLGLDLGLLEAGASVKGEFENRLRGVIDEIKGASRPTILFIDEAHMLIGAGGQTGGSDAANLLKPALARGELRTIAATTWSEYKKYFEKDPALARRFQVVKLDEPDVPTAVQILRGLKDRYEAAHGVTVRDDAIVAAAELSNRYITGRLLPDKAVDLLDTAAARVRIGLGIKPAELENLESRLAGLERERQALARDVRYEPGSHSERLEAITAERAELESSRDALHARWTEERDAAQAVLDLRRQVGEAEAAAEAKAQQNDSAATDDAAQAAAGVDAADAASLNAQLEAARAKLKALQRHEPLVFIETDPDAVARVVSDWTGVPLGKMQRDAVNGVLALADHIKDRIRGQDHAVDQIAATVKAAQSGLRDPQQPMGVFLLVGPSGVGKTETALAIADQLFGGDQALVSINMSEFQEKHTVSRLVGSPPGYVGYGEGGVLTEAVRKRPYSVVLLDEVEKAHLDVVNLFYQVFDKGTLADGEGRIIDFSNTVVFLTSNLATEEITRLAQDGRPDPDTLASAIHPVLARHFKPALLARMTVVPYYTLPASELAGIVKLKLAKLQQRLAAANRIALTFEATVADTIAARCTEVDSGARNIDFILRKSLTPVLSDTVLSALAEGRSLSALHVEAGTDGGWKITPTEATA